MRSAAAHTVSELLEGEEKDAAAACKRRAKSAAEGLKMEKTTHDTKNAEEQCYNCWTQIGMFRPIRMDHTNCLQVAIKSIQ